MSDEISSELQERFARLKSQVVANGVRLVSEAELAENNRRRLERSRAKFSKGAKAGCRQRDVGSDRRAAKVSASRSTGPVRNVLAESENEFNTDDQAKLDELAGRPPALPSQREFEASGAAGEQNAILIELFARPDNLRKWIPMPYLCDLSGGHHMNNRAIDLRKHFEPRGFTILNRSQQVNGAGAYVSHYAIFPLGETAAE